MILFIYLFILPHHQITILFPVWRKKYKAPC